MCFNNFTMKEKSCLDCLNCKIIESHRRLSCHKGMWIKNDWDKKYIILTAKERETLDMKWRDTFNQARRCDKYEEVT